jgi:hypothetical protein
MRNEDGCKYENKEFSTRTGKPSDQGAQVQFEPSYPSISPITFGSIHMELYIGDNVPKQVPFCFFFVFLVPKVPFMPFCFLVGFFWGFWGLFIAVPRLSRDTPQPRDDNTRF